LKLGYRELDAVLPDGSLPRGVVTELAVVGGAALATSVCLRACRMGQQQKGFGQDYGVPWCAFVDPSATLYGPGAVRMGVTLERLLVVRPGLKLVGAVALRLVKSRLFAVTVIDTLGVPGSGLGPSNLFNWARGVRQLSAAAQGFPGVVLLITDAAARRPLPLPVALRFELSRPSQNKLVVRVAKDRFGRLSGVRSLCWPPLEAEASAGAESMSERDHARLFA
jgi:recombination protein RecA